MTKIKIIDFADKIKIKIIFWAFCKTVCGIPVAGYGILVAALHLDLKGRGMLSGKKVVNVVNTDPFSAMYMA